MTKICPILTIAQTIQAKGHNIDPIADCKKEQCMFFNDSQNICVLSGQRPESEQRLIDANRFTDFIDCGHSEVVNMLDSAPTVPAEIVVHCENCRFRHTVEDGTYGTFYACGYNDEQNSGLGGLVQSNDYCSYGERRESEES